MVQMIHATPQMTNTIMRGGKKKKHMKNKYKNVVKGCKPITLYPSPQFKKYSDDKQEKYHTSMKQNNGFDKKHKNVVYNERNKYQVLREKFDEFYKQDMSSSDFNEKVDKYHSDMNSTESDYIKSSYSKFLLKKKEERKIKKEMIEERSKYRKEVKNKSKDERESREIVFRQLEKDVDSKLGIKYSEKIPNYKLIRRTEMIQSVLKRNGYNNVYAYIHGGKELNYKFKTIEKKNNKKDNNNNSNEPIEISCGDDDKYISF
jgi:hypothetical protein